MPSTPLTVKIKEIKLRVFETPGFFGKNVKYFQKNFKQSATPNFRFPCSGFSNNQSRMKSVSTFIGAENPVECKSRRWH